MSRYYIRYLSIYYAVKMCKSSTSSKISGGISLLQGKNPANLRLRILNTNASQVIRVAIWYATPQRLDINRKGTYIYPKNAKIAGNSFIPERKNQNLADDQFEPQLSDISGANYFDPSKQILYVVVRGRNPVDIKTMPVIRILIGEPIDNHYYKILSASKSHYFVVVMFCRLYLIL